MPIRREAMSSRWLCSSAHERTTDKTSGRTPKRTFRAMPTPGSCCMPAGSAQDSRPPRSWGTSEIHALEPILRLGSVSGSRSLLIRRRVRRSAGSYFFRPTAQLKRVGYIGQAASAIRPLTQEPIGGTG